MRSKTLSDYLKEKLPSILCGIMRKKDLELQEAVKHVEDSDHFPLMLPNRDDFPSAQGYTYRSHGVWVSPHLDHIMFKNATQEVKMPVHQFEKMNALATKEADAFDKDVSSISVKRLVPRYNMYESIHKSAINKYANNSMNDINNKITRGDRLSTEDRGNIHMMDETTHVHTTPHEFAVYSGISPEHAHAILSNDRVNHPAFLSTSLSPHIAAGFTRFKADRQGTGGDGIEGHILKIMVPHKHPGAYIDHMSLQEERELILPRNTVLNIHRDKTLYAPIPHSNGKSFFTIHHATIETK